MKKILLIFAMCLTLMADVSIAPKFGILKTGDPVAGFAATMRLGQVIRADYYLNSTDHPSYLLAWGVDMPTTLYLGLGAGMINQGISRWQPCGSLRAGVRVDNMDIEFYANATNHPHYFEGGCAIKFYLGKQEKSETFIIQQDTVLVTKEKVITNVVLDTVRVSAQEVPLDTIYYELDGMIPIQVSVNQDVDYLQYKEIILEASADGVGSVQRNAFLIYHRGTAIMSALRKIGVTDIQLRFIELPEGEDAMYRRVIIWGVK